MLTLIHGADFHLDSAFGALSEDKARVRRQEGRDVLSKLGQLCREAAADALLLSGDLFDGQQVYPETMQTLRKVLGELPCRVFIAPGNHDPYHPASPYARETWPDNVHIFRQPAIEAVDCGDYVVYGAAFTQESCSGLLEGFHAPEDGRIHVMVLHGDTEGRASPYNPIRPEQVACSGLTYLALGHIHQYSGPRMAGNTVYAYPGCPAGRGFDELGEKGVLLVTAEPGQAQIRRISLDERRYEILTVDLTGQEPLEAIRKALPPEHERDIYRIILRGEAEHLSPGLLQQMLENEFFQLELRDETHLPQELWQRAGEDSLRGIFLQKLKERYDAGGEEERQRCRQAARFALAAMDHRDG